MPISCTSQWVRAEDPGLNRSVSESNEDMDPSHMFSLWRWMCQSYCGSLMFSKGYEWQWSSWHLHHSKTTGHQSFLLPIKTKWWKSWPLVWHSGESNLVIYLTFQTVSHIIQTPIQRPVIHFPNSAHNPMTLGFSTLSVAAYLFVIFFLGILLF